MGARRGLALLLLVGLCACRPASVPPAATSPRATTAASPTPSPSPRPPSPLPSPSPPPAAAPSAAAAPAPACPPPGARAAPPAGRPRYRINASVRPAERIAEGDLTVRFTPDLPTDRLVFRLWANAPVTAAGGVRLDAGPVTVGGAPAVAARPDATTMIVGRPLAAGEAVEVSMPWRLTMGGPVNDRISASADSVRMGSFVPLLAWEPGRGWAEEPPTRIHGETASTPAADFDLTVTVPEGYTTLASGADLGGGRWLAEAVPDVGVSVGRFSIAEATTDGRRGEPVRIRVGVNAGIAENPATYATKIARVIANHSQRFGPYPWPAYTLAITPGLRGGMEYPGHVMQGPGTIGRSTSHEVAHQWFYALVLNNQARDPWLDEGLATWGEAGFEGSLGSFVRRSIPGDARGRAGAPMTFWDGHGGSYYRGVYVQPAQALAALGPAVSVDCALASYVAASAYRIARPDDLLRALSSVFPEAPAVFSRYGLGG